MNDGVLHDIKGWSASEAMAKALEKNRGQIVIGCYAGNPEIGHSQSGRIVYEIPPHKALPILDEE